MCVRETETEIESVKNGNLSSKRDGNLFLLLSWASLQKLSLQPSNNSFKRAVNVMYGGADTFSQLTCLRHLIFKVSNNVHN